ncbi:B3 domain-containing protein Os03g0120900-like [Zingiber officinale]|uniref:TF-B3 domain-containing protein n=1 Tax=Zingiber officinale TaxID=94328 RepID=A0A8J5CCY1_ZINOF|nr:B3 domain-containing protein Os03g0120900-like [Zingiber officinale]KAG6472857.1 hypothetical protein ZIOFF_070335 [Zingiber officinale]
MEAFRVVIQPAPSSSSPSLLASLWMAAEGGGGDNWQPEHMFDKVVTPSDVGKLNRLVIPKQCAERFFPLEPEMADKGVVLCFEDAGGERWSFRYSYWHSSQSYVMTKGWSRFVKDKNLHAGDTVSFLRATAGSRLFIDLHHRLPPPGVAPWGGHTAADHLVRYSRTLPVLPLQPIIGSVKQTASDDDDDGTVLDSVPVVIGAVTPTPKAAPKRLRLFGVNLEYCSDLPPPDSSMQQQLRPLED